MKNKIIGYVMGFILVAGFAIPGASAWTWKPLDPSTYWSPTEPDYADTANPGHFFYHDLAENGYKVFDPLRYAKEVLIEAQTAAQLEINIKETLNDTLNILGIDSSILNYNNNKYAITVEDVRKASGVNTITVHANDGTFDYSRTNIPFSETSDNQKKALAEGVTSAIAAAYNIETASNNVLEQSGDILNQSANADGLKQVIQSNTSMKSVENASAALKNKAINNKLSIWSMIAIKDAADENLSEKLRIHLSTHDPFNRNSTDELLDPGRDEKRKAKRFKQFDE